LEYAAKSTAKRTTGRPIAARLVRLASEVI
jgi:hypothetical protein